MVWTLTVKDLGPFKDASIEVKPLTIFIGRNSSGKSLLLRLMWALSTAEPDYVSQGKFLQEKLTEKGLTEDRLKQLSQKDANEVIKIFEEYVKLYAEALMISILEGAKGKIREVLNDLKGTIRLSSRRVSITVYLCNRKAEIVPGLEELLEVNFTGLEVNFKESDNIRLRLEALGFSSIRGILRVRTGTREMLDDLNSGLSSIFGSYFMPFFQNTILQPVNFLVDSRAGLLRYKHPTLLKVRDLSDVITKDFIYSYLALLEEFHKGEIEISKDLFEELGFSLKVVDEGGFKVPYVQLWNGKVFPLSEAPSGVREALPMALALNSKKSSVVYIEEPEAHLHPRAQRIVAKMIANAVKKGKYVIITTHSEFLLYTLSDLVGLYRKDKEAGLDPNMVSAYLLKRGDKYTEVEKLTVDEYGISEEEFGKVAEEMLDERGKIYD